MKIISWNVNGLRAVLNKDFMTWFKNQDAEIVCLQETKISEGQVSLDLEGYDQFYSYAEKKGYSGTAVFSRIRPLSVSYGIDVDIHDHEGRTITVEYEDFYLVCVYVPNSQDELRRLDYRQQFNKDFEEYLVRLDSRKPVVMCGDLNVAHTVMDIKNPKSNERNAGFTIEERNDFSRLLSRGFKDSWREMHPEEVKYSWWSYRFRAREKNAGWRIDYFVVSDRLMDKVQDTDIQTDVLGSDHCPVLIEF
ncbi:MAG: exodeoxyribonuclease III [Spirochaetales bacterium]|nr:exodeoxyribonuclease III [Spirochaetales bacterium]